MTRVSSSLTKITGSNPCNNNKRLERLVSTEHKFKDNNRISENNSKKMIFFFFGMIR
jgi:hypothetical protein